MPMCMHLHTKTSAVFFMALLEYLKEAYASSQSSRAASAHTRSVSLFFFFLQLLLFNPPKDPWAPSEGSAEVVPELDLFAMKPAEGSTAAESPDGEELGITPSAASSSAPSEAPGGTSSSAPTAAPASSTTTTASTAESTAPPALDIFGGKDSAFIIVLWMSFTLIHISLSLCLLYPPDSFIAPAPAPTSPPKAETPVVDLLGMHHAHLCVHMSAVFDGLGDLLMPAITPQSTAPPPKAIGSDLDSSLANLVGSTSYEALPPSAGAGAPMMPQPMMMGQPMMRPPFAGTAVPGAPLSPGPAAQSPKKPPTKDPLADLNIKDFL
uniref:Uncharacterized protein n=1 Tax=Electrophorus electricus TaxID=8005 RepID=A0A4W4F9J5_ELEEL